MVDPIIQWLVDLIPKALFAEILDFTWSLIVLTVAVLFATQMTKITARLAQNRKDPSEGFIHTCSFLFAAGFAFTTWTDSPLSERFVATFIAWGLAAGTARYGLALIKLKYPRLYAVFQSDRRRNEITPLIHKRRTDIGELK